MSIATLDKSLDKTLEKLAKRMRDRMAVGGTSVAQTLEKGRGALPKHYRAKADRILEALQMANQPRLAQQIDVAGIDREPRFGVVNDLASQVARREGAEYRPSSTQVAEYLGGH